MSKGHLLLRVAAEYGNFEAFKILFEKNAKVDGFVLGGLFDNKQSERERDYYYTVRDYYAGRA